MKALEKRPEARWASAADFSDALEHAVVPRTVGGGTAIQPYPRPRTGAPASGRTRPHPLAGWRLALWRFPPRSTWRAAVTAFAVTVVVGLLLGVALRGPRRHPARPALSSAFPLAPYTAQPTLLPSAVPSAPDASSATAADSAPAASASGSASALPALTSATAPTAANVPRRVYAPMKAPAFPSRTSVTRTPDPPPPPSPPPAVPPSAHRPFGVEQ